MDGLQKSVVWIISDKRLNANFPEKNANFSAPMPVAAEKGIKGLDRNHILNKRTNLVSALSHEC